MASAYDQLYKMEKTIVHQAGEARKTQIAVYPYRQKLTLKTATYLLWTSYQEEIRTPAVI